jgi:Tol biopolymer transport system component
MRRILALLLVLGALAATAGHAAPSSPSRIVFASNRGPNVNNSEIFSIRADGSRYRDLSRNQGHDGSPVWSPDGRRVAFWSERLDFGNLVRALYVMRADGTGQRRLTPAGLGVSGVGEAPSWSPDGSRIAFGADSADGGRVWVVRADGSGLTPVGYGIEPAWSPRSNQIAFVASSDFGGRLALVNADGSGLRMLTDGENNERLPGWAPDGRSLAFLRFDREPPASVLYRIGVDGRGLRRLAPISIDLVARSPSWAPDGSLITFQHAGAVWVISPRGTGLRRLALGNVPGFSPDGRLIAFVRGSALAVMRPDGSARRTVRAVNGDFFTSGPVWSRDRRTLVFATARENADYELYVVGANGTNLRRLTRNRLDERLPTWSPARRRIAFVRGGQIFVMSASGTGARRVARGTYPTWSRTGAELAFSRLGTVFVVPIHGGTARPLVIGSKPAWSPTNDQIAFVRGLDLVVVGRRSGVERRITDLDCDRSSHTQTIIGIPEWSPDGRRLVVPLLCIFGRAEVPSALVVDVDGGNRRFLPIEALDFARLAWSPDGSRIAFSTYQGLPRIATAKLDGTGQTSVTFSAGDDRDVDW